MKNISLIIVVFLVLGCFVVDGALAQVTSKKKVVTLEFEPFVVKKDERFTGFVIELWEDLAAKLQIDYEIYEAHTTPKLLQEVSSGIADYGVGGTSITYEREKIIDFSHSFFHTGLQILVLDNARPSFINWLSAIFSLNLLYGFGAFLLLIFLSANMVWVCERHSNPDEFPGNYLEGIWEAFWWSAVTITTVGYGDKSPKSRLGRTIALVWMIAGIFLIANFTATVTASLTMQQIKGPINGPEDLIGKRVATHIGASAADYLKTQRLTLIESEHINDAYNALLSGDVDAVVYDSAALLHFAKEKGQGKVKVVGPIFREKGYGIVFPKNSADRERFNQVLLQYKESGEFKELYHRWFGSMPGE